MLHETNKERVTEVRLGKVMRGKETRVAMVTWFHRKTGKMATDGGAPASNYVGLGHESNGEMRGMRGGVVGII